MKNVNLFLHLLVQMFENLCCSLRRGEGCVCGGGRGGVGEGGGGFLRIPQRNMSPASRFSRKAPKSVSVDED